MPDGLTIYSYGKTFKYSISHFSSIPFPIKNCLVQIVRGQHVGSVEPGVGMLAALFGECWVAPQLFTFLQARTTQAQ